MVVELVCFKIDASFAHIFFIHMYKHENHFIIRSTRGRNAINIVDANANKARKKNLNNDRHHQRHIHHDMTSANAHARPLALWSFRCVLFGIHWHSDKYAKIQLNVLVWKWQILLFYSWIFLTYSFAHTLSLKYLIVHHRKNMNIKRQQQQHCRKNWNGKRIEHRDVYYYIFVVFVIPFTVSMICDNFMCHFCGAKKKYHRGNVGCVCPFMFDARVYVCSFFAACSFIWFLTARVHLSIKNTVDKHKCLNENNEYGLPITILWACTLCKERNGSTNASFVQMKNVQDFMEMNRHKNTHILQHAYVWVRVY